MRVGRGDRGQVGGIEALPFGLLVFVTGALLIVNIWGVVDTKFAAQSAARNAARHVVETASSSVSSESVTAGATVLAEEILADHGRRRPVDVVVSPTSGFDRCTRISVTVETSVPAIRLPFIGGFGRAFTISATHSELVDPTRSGLDGRADCIT